MITIDGSAGEGGGQVLRSALALSLVTGMPFRVERIRAKRPKPGLQRQHLTAVSAAAALAGARVAGAAPGSPALEFAPGPVRAGSYRFATGSAGSATLVAQTLFPALLAAGAPSELVVEGGTHNPFAPPFEFLDRVYLRALRAMGARVEAALERHGFFPAGGGRIRARVEPSRLAPIDLLERGAPRRREARAIVARLPRTIAERELAVVERELGWADDERAVVETGDSSGPGNALVLEAEFERASEVACAFGERGVPAETVAAKAVAGMRRYLDAGVPVGEHLADQLLIPLAIAGGGRFRTLPPTGHTRTNAEVIERFLPVAFAFREDKGTCEIEVLRRPSAIPERDTRR